jgi:shikimate kinase
MKENIVLVGFMGTGKTTVGRELARRLDFEFVNTDDLVEEMAGKTIPELFTADGEQRFREIERSAVAALAGREGMIVSTGGGAFAFPENRQALEELGLTVALAASPKTLVARLGASASTERPLLAGAASERLEQLLAERAPLYAKARHTVRTDDKDVSEVVEEVVGLWNARETAKAGSV